MALNANGPRSGSPGAGAIQLQYSNYLRFVASLKRRKPGFRKPLLLSGNDLKVDDSRNILVQADVGRV